MSGYLTSVSLNRPDHESENVSDKTIFKSEWSDKEINLFSNKKKRKSKKGRVGGKSTWKENTNDNLIDFICSNEYSKKKLIFANKASKNAEIFQKIILEVRKRCEKRGEIY